MGKPRAESPCAIKFFYRHESELRWLRERLGDKAVKVQRDGSKGGRRKAFIPLKPLDESAENP